jgi:hypothetical protein
VAMEVTGDDHEAKGSVADGHSRSNAVLLLRSENALLTQISSFLP